MILTKKISNTYCLLLKPFSHMKKGFTNLYCTVLATLFLSSSLLAQQANNRVKPHPDAVNIALNYLKTQQTAWNLTTDDVLDVFVQDHYITEMNGLTHVFILQQHQGIELYNALVNVNVMASGEILYVGNRFMRNFAASVNATTPTLTPQQAIKKACDAVKVNFTEGVVLKTQPSKNEYIFDKGTFVLSDIDVRLKYFKINDQSSRLVWDLNIDQLDGQDHWSLRIDALTGNILDKTSFTTHCSFDKDAYLQEKTHNKGSTDVKNRKNALITEGGVPTANQFFEKPNSVKEEATQEVKRALHAATVAEEVVVGGGSYRVFALPTESPAHGARTLVTDPADATASPYGWHDTNGVTGAEYQITRGNNAWAYLDLMNTNASSNNEPNGGATLAFDHPFIATVEPDSNRQAATVNLFYTNNMIHDISFLYGFNEEAGNFQTKNYGGAPGAGDYVQAQVQDSRDATPIQRNNANFSTPSDGGNGRMQMYVWNGGTEKLLHVTAPNALISDIEAVAASFGAAMTTTPVVGDAVFVNDGTANSTQGCGTLTGNLTGKIALIDRGSCEFGAKALKAQQKGAIGVVICYFDNNVGGMAAGAVGSQVTIPVVAISKSDADRIRAAAGNGLRLSINRVAGSLLPAEFDGDFDNGIVIHEYTHGISTRLTGGRLNSNCLNNAEEGGEGWSDFLGLALTARPGDRGATRRPIGTYVQRQDVVNGSGIRATPYSTDMAVSTQTYETVLLNPEVHAIGEVWCAALWDLYWAMADKYGWDANVKNINSGNGKALRLVMDGMKIQPCSPGFLDARDAILAADRADFAGDNQCLIWEVFARRGMGWNAKQGLSTSAIDNTEGYEKYPYCVKTLKLTKTGTESIKPGDPISYSIQVINHKGVAATNVVVTDEIPQFTTFVAGSANRAVTQTGSVLTFNLGTMSHNDTITITYRVNSDINKKSIAQFSDDLERGDRLWDYEDLKSPQTGNIWEILDVYARSGTRSFSVAYPAVNAFCDETFKMLRPLTIVGTKPVLRFYQRYETEPAFDVGILQVSTDGTNWRDMGDKIFKNPYRGNVFYSLFAIPNQKGWWGKETNWKSTVVDLSSYIGQSVNFRWRWGADSTDNKVGWFVDDIAVMDMVNYNGRARLTSAQGDTASAEVPERGTIVDPTVIIPTAEITEGVQLKVYPNPATSLLNVHILVSDIETTFADVSLIAADGREMWRQETAIGGVKETLLPVDISKFPSGVYVVKIRTNKKTLVEKIIKH